MADDYNEKLKASILKGPDKKKSVVSTTDISEFDAMKVGERVAKESVVLELHIRQPGFRKKMESSSFVKSEFGQEFGQAADPDFLHVYQDLIDKKEIKDLAKHRSAMIDYIKSLSVPAKMLANGMYLIPLRRVEEIDQRITLYVEEREKLLNDFQDKWPSVIEAAKISRGKHFNENDYPEFSYLRSFYKTEAKYLSFNVPAALEKINTDLHKREMAKVQLEWADTATEVRNALRASFIKLTSHFRERLGKDPETGKMKTFHESSIENIKDFISTLGDRNLTNDVELETLANEAKALVEGVDVKQVRTDEEFRKALEKKFDDFVKKTEGLEVIKEREFSFDE